MGSFRDWTYSNYSRDCKYYLAFDKMNIFDILRLIGISLSFIVLIIIFIITNNNFCFNPAQLFITYLLLIYTLVVEIISLISK